MDSLDENSIYLGFWTDWSEGRFRGATWTLSGSGAGLLQSFTAIAITFVFAQLWSTIAFLLYHARSTAKPQDGLLHQQQAVLRNAGALASAVVFAKQAFYWHGKASKAIIRSLAWMGLALGFAAVAGLMGTLSGYASSKSSLNRLIVSNNCGYDLYTDDTGTINSTAYALAMSRDCVTAANYARTCYEDSAKSFEQCKRFVRPRLKWTGYQNVQCPFERGICSNGDQAAFTLASDKIDSLVDLGINSPPSDRLYLQKRMTCSSIREIDHYSQSGTLVFYNFGSIGSATNSTTFVYNRLAEAALVPYSLQSTYSYASHASSWTPITALNRTDADVVIIFISANTVSYAFSNNDPIFSATKTNVRYPGYYLSDYDVSTLACAEQYQVCKPAGKVASDDESDCSSWMGSVQFMYQSSYLDGSLNENGITMISPSVRLWKKDEARLSATQLAILERLYFVLPRTSTYHATSSRHGSALRLQETVSELIQTQQLPDEYWTQELGWWFDASLARLQQGIVDFALGPTNSAGGNRTLMFSGTEATNLCKRQMTHNVGNSTVNYSVLALIVIYAVGLAIILLSLAQEWLSQFLFDRFWPEKSYKTKMWTEDGFLLLQRTAFETSDKRGGADSNDRGEHTGVTWTSDSVPVTTRAEKLIHFSLGYSTSSYCLSEQPQHAEDGEGPDEKATSQVAVAVT